MCLRFAAIEAELYPPGWERLCEVTIGVLAVVAAVVVEGDAVGYPPRELMLEQWADEGWPRDCGIFVCTSL